MSPLDWGESSCVFSTLKGRVQWSPVESSGVRWSPLESTGLRWGTVKYSQGG